MDEIVEKPAEKPKATRMRRSKEPEAEPEPNKRPAKVNCWYAVCEFIEAIAKLHPLMQFVLFGLVLIVAGLSLLKGVDGVAATKDAVMEGAKSGLRRVISPEPSPPLNGKDAPAKRKTEVAGGG